MLALNVFVSVQSSFSLKNPNRSCMAKALLNLFMVQSVTNSPGDISHSETSPSDGSLGGDDLCGNRLLMFPSQTPSHVWVCFQA